MSRLALFLSVAIAIAAAPAAPGQDGQPAPPSTPSAPASPTQIYCPVTTTEEIDPEIFTDYKGVRVYFCCDRCKVRFTKDPEQYVPKLGAFSAALDAQPLDKDQPEAPHEHEHAHGDAAIPQSAADTAKETAHEHTHSTGEASDDHDHKEHGPGTGPRWLKWLGGFHPPTTNFPIGVLVAAALAEVLFIWRRRPEFDHAARFCVVFAAVMGVAAGVLGWFFAGIRLTDSDTLLAIHRWLGTGTVVWMLVLLFLSERARQPSSEAGTLRPRTWYRVFLFGGTGLVLTTGFFGGAMVYGLDHYLWR